jgi:UDP-glucuronate decarboxylase
LQATGSTSKIISAPLPADDPKIRQPDIGLATEKLGWKPEVELDRGLASTLDYFKAKLLLQ